MRYRMFTMPLTKPSLNCPLRKSRLFAHALIDKFSFRKEYESGVSLFCGEDLRNIQADVFRSYVFISPYGRYLQSNHDTNPDVYFHA